MKYLITFVVGVVAGLLAPLMTLAQAPAWQMALTAGGGAYSQVTALATDEAGDVYLAGRFSQEQINFGPLVLRNAVTAGPQRGFSHDIFIAKWSTAGQRFVWAQRAGGAGHQDAPRALGVFHGGVYVAGAFDSEAAGFGDYSLTRMGRASVFIARLSAGTGRFEWVRRAGGSGYDGATALAVSEAGVYVAGGSDSPVLQFEGGQLTGAGGYDGFVVKLNAAGGFEWAQRAGGSGFDQITALAARGTTVYAAGNFEGSGFGFGAARLVAAGAQDGFVAKLLDVGGAGEVVWAQRLGGSGNEEVRSLALSGSSVYVTGAFASARADFGATTLTNATPAVPDMFIAKLRDEGGMSRFEWSLGAGGDGPAVAVACVATPGHVYVTGMAGGAASLGSVSLPSTSNPMQFVAQLTEEAGTGTFTWAQTIVGLPGGPATVLTLSGADLYVGGMISSFAGAPASFGTLNVPSTGGPVAFLASLPTQDFTSVTLTPTTPARPGLAFTLAPNPARATTAVQLPAVPGATTATLTLLDALGRTVRVRTAALPAAGRRYELELAGLPAGVYALQVAAGAAIATRRLVVD